MDDDDAAELPLLPERPIWIDDAHHVVDGATSLLAPLPPPELDDMMVILSYNQLTGETPWHRVADDDHGGSVRSAVLTIVLISEPQFLDVWTDLLHRRYDNTCLDVVGSWRVTRDRCVSGRIRIRLEDDRVRTRVPELRIMVQRAMTRDDDDDILYQLICKHLDFKQAYYFELIRKMKKPLSKLQLPVANGSKKGLATCLGFPYPFERVTKGFMMKSILFSRPDSQTVTQFKKLKVDLYEKVCPRSHVASYLLNFTQDLIHAD